MRCLSPIGTGNSVTTHRQWGAVTTLATPLTENSESMGSAAYAGKVILTNITATFSVAGSDQAIVPILDAASLVLRFAYETVDAMNSRDGGRITSTGRIDYETLTDADTTTDGVQHRITLTATQDEVTATHNVLVTITNADDAPMIDSDDVTPGDGVSTANAIEIASIDITLLEGVDSSALYYKIDENETPSGALFTIPATDADGDTITYMLTEATDAGGADVSNNFEINAGTGAVSLVSGEILDHETRSYVRLEVTASSTSTMAGAGGEKTQCSKSS